MESILKNDHAKLKNAMMFVKSYEEKLALLNAWWGKITLIGKINSHNVAGTILDDMEITKKEFGKLQKNLIENLLFEHLQKLSHEDGSKAQVVIDILIRNLFERTADVGFLATDDDIRGFLLNPNPAEADLVFMQARLQEYVKKYSVYDEILLLDTDGSVRLHLDASNAVKNPKDALIEATLTTSDDYVETFRHSDLQPNKRHSLIYSCKITQKNKIGAKVLGVLCLCFRFDDELTGIFANLLPPDDPRILAILDQHGRVIASSDECSIALKATFNAEKSPRIQSIGGVDYLVHKQKTNGYQGFYGLGWSGQVFSPMRETFSNHTEKNVTEVDSDLIQDSKAFSKALKEIRRVSTNINDDLSLVVLNGKITAARKEAKEFMPVLEAIKNIGEDIANIFSISINSLQNVVIGSRLNEVEFMASLAVDIMDRNLYERANDCRWWALTSAFRRILAEDTISPEAAQDMSDILQYINDLYTVYTNLYVYDVQGKILAVSNADAQALVGQVLDDKSGASIALHLTDAQKYVVSPFAKTVLYGDKPTYLYNASITSMGASTRCVGGIGLVFDSEPEFQAILSDILPKNKDQTFCDACFDVFTDRSKNILSYFHGGLAIGGQLALDDKFFVVKNGESLSEIVAYGGQHYMLGVSASNGYREYKTTGDYQNDVLAFVFIPL